jgi:hypothetical protein
MRIAYSSLVSRPERKRTVGRPERRWKDNIRKDFKYIGCNDVTHFIWLRIWCTERGDEPSDYIRGIE